LGPFRLTAVSFLFAKASVRDTAAVYAMSDIAYTAAVYAISDIAYTADTSNVKLKHNIRIQEYLIHSLIFSLSKVRH